MERTPDRPIDAAPGGTIVGTAVDGDLAAMRLALDEAVAAELHDDVPIGAVVVRDGVVIAARHNERELTGDPTAHAETLAIRDAADVVGHWRLGDCTLYVTLEPCVMCAGALVNARIGALVYAATDPKAGAVVSLYQVCADTRLNHRPPVRSGVLAAEAGQLLRDFFAARRNEIRERPGRARQDAASLPPRKGARVDEWDGLENR